MHRISNLLFWAHSSTTEMTQAQLEQWVPKLRWPKVNIHLASIAQFLQSTIYNHITVNLAVKYNFARDAILMLGWTYNPKNKNLSRDKS